jgi:hypothetical protein
VFIPAVLSNQRTRSVRGWRDVAVPVWAQAAFAALVVYVTISFLVLVRSHLEKRPVPRCDPQGHPLPSDPRLQHDQDALMLRLISGHLMVFYAASAMLLTHRLRTPEEPAHAIALEALPLVTATAPPSRGFPMGMRGTVEPPSDLVDADAWLRAVVAELTRRDIAVARTADGAVDFTGPPIMGMHAQNKAPFLISERGRISIEREGNRPVARYQTVTRRFVILGTAGIAFMGVTILLASSTRDWRPFAFLPIGWLWIVGMNYLVGRSALRKLLRECAVTARSAPP